MLCLPRRSADTLSQRGGCHKVLLISPDGRAPDTPHASFARCVYRLELALTESNTIVETRLSARAEPRWTQAGLTRRAAQ
jgi:hypothetical protein